MPRTKSKKRRSLTRCERGLVITAIALVIALATLVCAPIVSSLGVPRVPDGIPLTKSLPLVQ